MDRIRIGDYVKLKHIVKRSDRNVAYPVGIVDEINGAYFYVSVRHHDAEEVIPYECYENELEKITEAEHFRCVLAGHNDLPNDNNSKIKI